MNRELVYQRLHEKMLQVGFVFERKQMPTMQNRKEAEFKYIHPVLLQQFKDSGKITRATKFYIKPLSDDSNCEIGLTTGKSSPLYDSRFFTKPNAIDSHDNSGAWANREKDNALDLLLSEIENYLESRDFFPEENIGKYLDEGSKKTITVNKYERSRIARNKCIEVNGIACHVCKFNFYDTYGEIGKDYIHVHHIIPIHARSGPYKVNYKSDLVPVCPNCHSMLHRKINGEEPSIEELKQMLKENKR